MVIERARHAGQATLADAQVATSITEVQLLDAEKSAVQTLLAAAADRRPDLGADVGGNIDITA